MERDATVSRSCHTHALASSLSSITAASDRPMALSMLASSATGDSSTFVLASHRSSIASVGLGFDEKKFKCLQYGGLK